jgi:hypothetical protein
MDVTMHALSEYVGEYRDLLLGHLSVWVARAPFGANEQGQIH